MSGTSSSAAQGKTPSCAAEAETQEREQGQLVRHSHCQNMPGACMKGVQNMVKRLPLGKSPPQSSAEPLCDRSLVTLPDVMVFAGSVTLCRPRTSFSLARHFFWLTSHPWLAWLQLTPWERGTNPPQHGPAISSPTPGTSWGCQVRSACRAARSQSPSSSLRCMAHLRCDPPASPPFPLPAAPLLCRILLVASSPASGPLPEVMKLSSAPVPSRCSISATSIDVRSFLTAPVLLLKT